MKLHLIEEPQLEFGSNRHICPRFGIKEYSVYDSRMDERRNTILVGAVGTEETLEKFDNWITRCKSPIEAKEKNRQPRLYPEFCGFNTGLGFKADLKTGSNIVRPIQNSDLQEVLDIENWNRRVEAAVELYYNKVKFLAQNRATVDVIVCVMTDELYESIGPRKKEGGANETLEVDPDQADEDAYESNFRRALKARSMHLGKPLQLVRESALERNPSKHQDDATRAWNFCTALYYKANKTVPWRLLPATGRPDVCFVGVGFYRSRDRKILNTSLAQIFDELGNGVILRGTPDLSSKEWSNKMRGKHEQTPIPNYRQRRRLPARVPPRSRGLLAQ